MGSKARCSASPAGTRSLGGALPAATVRSALSKGRRPQRPGAGPGTSASNPPRLFWPHRSRLARPPAGCGQLRSTHLYGRRMSMLRAAEPPSPALRRRPSRTDASEALTGCPGTGRVSSLFPITPNMAPSRQSQVLPPTRASGIPSMADCRCSAPASPAAARAGSPCGAARPVRRALELSRRQDAKGGEERSGAAAASRCWEEQQPTAAATLLARCVAAGVVRQVTARRGR